MAKKYSNIIDLLSSPFRYSDYDEKLAEQKKGKWEVENPNFITDYVNAIYNAHLDKDNLILLAMYPEVKKEMDRRKIRYLCAYSDISAKPFIQKRFALRNNDPEFANKMIAKFDARFVASKESAENKIFIYDDQFLEQVLINYAKQQ